jgi:hypothetical protein
LWKRLPGGEAFLQDAQRHADYNPGWPELVQTSRGEVHALLRQLDLSDEGPIVDVWAGKSGIATAMAGWRAESLSVFSSDVVQRPDCPRLDMVADALSPTAYEEARRQLGGIGVIVSSPWWVMLDLAVPLACHYAAAAVAMHLPAQWLFQPRAARAVWLASLAAQGRVMVIGDVPRGAFGHATIWLVIFSSAAARVRMVRPGREEHAVPLVLERADGGDSSGDDDDDCGVVDEQVEQD